MFGEATGLVDGNVVRVLSRLLAIGSDSKNDKVVKVSACNHWRRRGEGIEYLAHYNHLILSTCVFSL